MNQDRCVLAGAPRVGFYNGSGAPEDDLLPSAVKAVLRMRGENLGFVSRPGFRDPWHQVHCYLLGSSGLAFRMVWNRDLWAMGDGSPYRCCTNAMAPIHRALRAAGYGCTVLLKPGFAEEHEEQADPECDEAAWRRLVVESIRDRGLPVIALGVIGPPEPCLVTGFEDGGELLIGWNAFQEFEAEATGVTFEPDGQFRVRGWFQNTEGLVLIGDPIQRPDDIALDCDSLRMALEMMRTPRVRGRATGLASFSEWADSLLAEPFLPGLDADGIHQHYEVHHQRGGDLAEARAFGSCYLRDLVARHPDLREPIGAAERCFDDEHDLVWALWEFMSGMIKTDQGQDRFTDRGIRGRMAPLVRLMRTRDCEAATHLARAEETLREKMHNRRRTQVPANPKAVVSRQGGQVLVEGTGPLEWGSGRDCTFPGCLAAALELTERPVAYNILMAGTGLAFRFRWSNPDTIGGWDRSCACGEYLEEWNDIQATIGRALYAEFPGVTQDPPDDPNVRLVMSDLDAGLPVMASVDGPDIGLIVGYRDSGRTLLCRKYGSGSGLLEVGAEAAMGGFQLRLGPLGPEPDRRQVLAAALRTAVRNWQREKTSAGYAIHGKGFLYGNMGLHAWADDLVNRAGSDEEGRFFHLNSFVYQTLLDARRAAVTYLRGQAALEGGEIARALSGAADLYAIELEVLEARVADGSVALQVDETSEISWSPEGRSAERQALLRAAELEGQAVARLGAAAHLLEAVPPPMGFDGCNRWALLPGVPRIGYDIHLCPLPGSLHAALAYLGDNPSYDELMGFSGACFRRFWQRDDGGNVDLMYLGEEMIHRLSAGLTRDLALVTHETGDQLAEEIKQSIWMGRPVVTFGIIGPPEACLVTGYDRHGWVMMGWSYFQDSSVPGLFQRPDWSERAAWPDGKPCAVLIGDRRRWPGPSRRDQLESALEWAVDLARVERRPGRPDHLSGLSACAAWAQALEVDADYPADDDEVMGTRLMVHGDQCVMLGERHNAAGFLRRMQGVEPAVEGLLAQAADLYQEAAGASVYPWGCDMGPAARQGLADAATRRAVAAEVRRSLAAEEKAVGLLAEALAILQG